MKADIARRKFLRVLAATGALGAASCRIANAPEDQAAGSDLDFPLIDFHAHVEGEVTMNRALELAGERGVMLGLAEHGGCRQGMKNDEEIKQYIARLEGLPVYKGMQAEGHDWMRCFSKEVVVQLDFVLADALVFPEKDGPEKDVQWVQLWTSAAKVTDAQDFMERYVDFNVRVISKEPIDIMANPTFLPEQIAGDYDALWTEQRMRKVIDAAAKFQVAIEINSRYKIPSLTFLHMAKEARLRFSFGSNAHDENVGKLDYSVRMAKELGLTHEDMFMPAPPDQKPILRRS